MKTTNVREQAFSTLYSDVDFQGLLTGGANSSPGSLHSSSTEYTTQYSSGTPDPIYGDALLLDGMMFPNRRNMVASPQRNISADCQHLPSLPASSHAAVENEVPHHHTPSRSSIVNIISTQPHAHPLTIATALQDSCFLSSPPSKSTSTVSTSPTPSSSHSPSYSPSSTSIRVRSCHTPTSRSSSCIDSGAGHSPLQLAAQKGYDGILRALLQHGVDPNEPDSQFLTPLVHAVIGGYEDVVRSLLSAGAIIGGGHYQPSALHYAVEHRREAVMRVLLDHCVKERIMLIDSCNECGQTPLHMAIDMDFETGVLMLLQAGANPRLKARKM